MLWHYAFKCFNKQYSGNNMYLYILQTDWNDGLAAAALVKSKGGPVPGFKQMTNR